MSRQLTPEIFLADIAGHQMKVKLDNDLYRHVVFQKPENSNLWFSIVTWPGCLTIHGDMGTWTFSRVTDMFMFFRDDNLRINADYWSEKLQHGTHGGREGAKVFNEDRFREHLLAQLTNYYSLEGEQLKEVTEALQNEVFCHDFRYDLLIAARDFKCGDFQFDSCELPDGKEYAYHFVWCLYAIVWGIQQYDAMVHTRKLERSRE